MTDDVSGSAEHPVSHESTIINGPTRCTSATESTSIHRTSYDASTDGSLDSAIVVAIAEASTTAPCDIEPLYETVDPDALTKLFSPKTTGGPRRRGMVSFVHHDCRVTIDGNEIIVEPDRSVC